MHLVLEGVSRWRDRLFRWIFYFRTGHGAWLMFLIAFANFAVIQYRLLVEHVPMLQALFPSLFIFAISFLAAYIPIATVVGWLEVRRATMPRQMAVMAEVNPYFRKPMEKEREYLAPLWASIAETLAKLCEKHGLEGEARELRREVERIQRWAGLRRERSG